MTTSLDGAPVALATLKSAKRISRCELYEIVWTEPMTRIAAAFEVSGSYLARICTMLDVPRPARGYWARLSAGQRLPRPPLPDPKPGFPIEWARDGHPPETAVGTPAPSKRRRRARTGPQPRPTVHALIQGSTVLFQAGRQSESGYLKPAKRLLPDIVVTEGQLARALDVANQLYLALEEDGHTVMIAPHGAKASRPTLDEREKGGPIRHYVNQWSPYRPTIIYVGTVAIGVTIYEMTENIEVLYKNGKYVRVQPQADQKARRRTYALEWTTRKDMATGRLGIRLFSADPRTAWSRNWAEEGSIDSEKMIRDIRKALHGIALEISELVAEANIQSEIRAREWEAQRERWRIENEERRIREAHENARSELESIIELWAKARRIAEFFDEALHYCKQLDDDESTIARKRIDAARSALAAPNALSRLLSWRTPMERLNGEAE